MSTKKKNLSEVSTEIPKDISKMKIGIVRAEWNEAITTALEQGAVAHLEENGLPKSHLELVRVPGTYELPLAAKWLAQRSDIDAVICLGCVIQGETRHFEFICQAAAQGIMDIGLVTGKPVIFGVLTPDTMQQAQDRSGGKHGNKGVEAAASALTMLKVKEECCPIGMK